MNWKSSEVQNSMLLLVPEKVKVWIYSTSWNVTDWGVVLEFDTLWDVCFRKSNCDCTLWHDNNNKNKNNNDININNINNKTGLTKRYLWKTSHQTEHFEHRSYLNVKIYLFFCETLLRLFIFVLIYLVLEGEREAGEKIYLLKDTNGYIEIVYADYIGGFASKPQ